MIQENIDIVRKVFSQKTWRRVALSFLIVIAPVLLFSELAEEVQQRETLAFDEATLLAINGWSNPLLDTLSITATQLGGVIGVGILVTLGAVVLWRLGKRARAVFLVMSVGGAGLLNVMLKAIFQRDRPELWQRLVTEDTFSFPSGHAMASSALALSLIVIFWHTRFRVPALIVALLYMVIIGFTRLYLGVHYPTDIVAGWIVSGMWVAAVTTAVYYRRIIFRVRTNKTS
jgi:membrane-associated phospholipid phosphatase